MFYFVEGCYTYVYIYMCVWVFLIIEEPTFDDKSFSIIFLLFWWSTSFQTHPYVVGLDIDDCYCLCVSGLPCLIMVYLLRYIVVQDDNITEADMWKIYLFWTLRLSIFTARVFTLRKLQKYNGPHKKYSMAMPLYYTIRYYTILYYILLE